MAWHDNLTKGSPYVTEEVPPEEALGAISEVEASGVFSVVDSEGLDCRYLHDDAVLGWEERAVLLEVSDPMIWRKLESRWDVSMDNSSLYWGCSLLWDHPGSLKIFVLPPGGLVCWPWIGIHWTFQLSGSCRFVLPRLDWVEAWQRWLIDRWCPMDLRLGYLEEFLSRKEIIDGYGMVTVGLANDVRRSDWFAELQRGSLVFAAKNRIM